MATIERFSTEFQDASSNHFCVISQSIDDLLRCAKTSCSSVAFGICFLTKHCWFAVVCEERRKDGGCMMMRSVDNFTISEPSRRDLRVNNIINQTTMQKCLSKRRQHSERGKERLNEADTEFSRPKFIVLLMN